MLLTLTGGAGAGKTTLATALAATADGRTVRLLHGDDYYVTDREQGVWARDEGGTWRLDVGDPRSIDAERLALEVDAALAGAAVVVLEGLFAERVVPRTPGARFDVFVDLPADLRLARKIQRKVLREGFPLEVLLRNYLEHRRAAHERHIEPARHRADLVVDGAWAPEPLARQIWSALAPACGEALDRVTG
ncbi:hypothetical protein [Kitasatospora sp. NBC_01266]|uniref:hypothetical protein n=1 Tax=Kitasatospora sp. NBC_01266 TaxID=2903572 RepID=UPI002E311DCC|nr:hypothetical protein [Kitasatospora sp. NBC_01266]